MVRKTKKHKVSSNKIIKYKPINYSYLLGKVVKRLMKKNK